MRIMLRKKLADFLRSFHQILERKKFRVKNIHQTDLDALNIPSAWSDPNLKNNVYLTSIRGKSSGIEAAQHIQTYFCWHPHHSGMSSIFRSILMSKNSS